MIEFNPTDEQQAINEAFTDGDHLVIEALAGTGKSSTLRFIGNQHRGRSGAYVAFNRTVAQEARISFPGNMTCGTGHSFAFRSIGHEYEHRLPGNRPLITGKDVAEHLGIKRWFRIPVAGRKDISPWRLGAIANETVIRFCRSDDVEIKRRHLPFLEGVPQERVDELADLVLPYAREIWDDMQKIDGVLGFTPDHYMKMWALSDPKLPFDFLAVDEAQDTNPVLSGVVKRQTHLQRILVGDSQQQLFEWRGAKDFIAEVAGWPDTTVLSLTQSFRFGEEIAEEANRWLDYLDVELRVRGLETIKSELTPIELPNAVLCRTNADALAQAMRAQSEGVTVGIVGGTEAIIKLAMAAYQLQNEGKTSHPELSLFKSWSDVLTYVEEEKPGGDLGTFVRLVDRYGATRVAAVASNCVDEKSAERVVATVHKVKGMEWEKVALDGGVAPNYDNTDKEGEISRSEYMVAYVAATRAKLELDTTAVQHFHRTREMMKQARQRAAVKEI